MAAEKDGNHEINQDNDNTFKRVISKKVVIIGEGKHSLNDDMDTNRREFLAKWLRIGAIAGVSVAGYSILLGCGGRGTSNCPCHVDSCPNHHCGCVSNVHHNALGSYCANACVCNQVCTRYCK